MKTVSILLLGLAIGLSGCSLHQRQEMEYAHYQDDAAAIREAHAAWLILSSLNRSREWPEARKKYNACIRELAAHLKEAKRKGGMDEILACTPLGRKYTVKAKLRQSTAVAAVIAFGTVLPHLWQVLRDYGLPSLLGPAMSISDLQAVPKFITLSDLLIFWLICRFAACLCMSRITLWLGQKLGNLLTALFISAVTYCLPALLSLSGMKNGIEWLGFYPLFHAAALWQNQGYNANGESYNAMWIPIFLVCAAFFLAWAIGQALIDDYDMIGVPDEVL